MLDDNQLLRQYAEGSESAFTELVMRYLPLVYSAAFRQTGGVAHQAEDVAQQVFTDLARKSASLPAGTVLAGWLHRATRFAVRQHLRTERRRQAREWESCSMQTPASETDRDWEQIRPWIDDALDKMNRLDRDALLLRFFEQRSLKEIGGALGLGEDAARKRVARALEKLRELLVCRGVTTSTSALSLVMAAKGIQSAPANLAGTIASSSLVAGATATNGITALHPLGTITMSQFKTVILAAAAVAGITTAVIQHQYAGKLRAENHALLEQSQNRAEAEAENQRQAVAQGQPELSKEQTAELMRLRAKVGQLRDELRKAQAASHSTAVAHDAASAKSDVSNNVVQPFTAAFTTRLGDKQTLVTGGWSTAPGMRTFMVMTPSIEAAKGTTTQTASDGSQFDLPNAKVTFNTSAIEIPETMLAQLGLDQLTADGNDSSVQSVLAAEDAKALLDVLNSPPDGVRVARGRINTADGISATMSMTGVGDSIGPDQPAGSEYTIGLTPNLTGDPSAINLAVNLQVIRPAGSSSAH